jgi:hypothetical protein
MTVQPSSFLAVLSAAALLLVSGNATSAHSHKQNGSPIVAGSTHNPVITHRHKPPICPGAGLPTCKPTTPPCRGTRIVNGQCLP